MLGGPELVEEMAREGVLGQPTRAGARKLERTTGVRLASWVEETFEAASRPTARLVLDPAELERSAAEGTAMPLDELVGYALGGVPADEDPGPAEAGSSRGRARPATGE